MIFIVLIVQYFEKTIGRYYLYVYSETVDIAQLIVWATM